MGMIKVSTDSCTGCRYCEVVCSFQREKNCRPAVSRIRIQKDESQGRDQPLVCRQCPDAPCAAACPTGALAWDGAAGIVVYDPGLCLCCGSCISACPFGAIWLAPEKDGILKCDLCGGDPACVKYCPTRTLSWEGQSAPKGER